jgi:hypothetical protein
MRRCSIIKNLNDDKSSLKSENKRISISPTLIYIDDNIRKMQPPKLRKNYLKVNRCLNESTKDNDSDFEYY